MPRKKPDPVSICFPVGVVNELQRLAVLEDLDVQWAALILHQIAKKILRKVRKRLKVGPIKNRTMLFAKVNAKILFSIRRDYKRYMDALVKHDIIELQFQYRAGHNSRAYRFTERFDIAGELENFKVTKLTVIKSLLGTNRIKQEEIKESEPEVLKRQERANEFQLDIDASLKWIAEQQEDHGWKQEQQMQIRRIVDHGISINKSKYGREYHELNRLHRHIRKTFLKYRGDHLVELDLPNAQPMLLYAMMDQQIEDWNEEKVAFQQALKNDFYKTFMDAWAEKRGQQIERRRMKLQVLSVMFGPVIPARDLTRQIFEEIFPKVYRRICIFKKKHGYAALSHELQRGESDLAGKMCQALEERALVPFFTVFDAIAVPSTIAGQVDEVLVNVLHDHGFTWIKSLL